MSARWRVRKTGGLWWVTDPNGIAFGVFADWRAAFSLADAGARASIGGVR